MKKKLTFVLLFVATMQLMAQDETIEKKLWDINYRESIVMDENEASLLYPRTYDNKSEDLKIIKLDFQLTINQSII